MGLLENILCGVPISILGSQRGMTEYEVKVKCLAEIEAVQRSAVRETIKAATAGDIAAIRFLEKRLGMRMVQASEKITWRDDS